MTLNRPEAMNAFNLELTAEFDDAIWSLERDDAVRVIVLTGAGKAFSTGMDLASGGDAFGAEAHERHNEEVGASDSQITERYSFWNMRTPMIAAINGIAIGAGLTLTFLADIRIVAEDARLRLPFVRLNVLPDANSTWLLPRLVGRLSGHGAAAHGPVVHRTRGRGHGSGVEGRPRRRGAARRPRDGTRHRGEHRPGRGGRHEAAAVQEPDGDRSGRRVHRGDEAHLVGGFAARHDGGRHRAHDQAHAAMDPVEAPADPGRPSGAVTPDAASRLRRWGPYGLAPVLVLVAVAFIDGMESNFIPGVLSLLQKEFHFGDTAAGAIPAAMAIAGLIVTLPAGYLADRTNRKRLLAIVVASWSVFTLASGLATTFLMFFVIRVILGAAANIDNPLSASLVTDFYPASSRARVFAFIRAGGYIGLALGIAIGGALGQAFGWRAPFFVMVIPGLVIAFFVFRLTEPPRGGFDAEPVHEGILERGAGALWADCRAVLAVPTLKFLFVGVAVAFAGFNGLGYWLPSFWERQFDLSEGEAAGLTGALALVATMVGFWIGGVLGDRWHRERPSGRIDLAAITLLLGGALLAVSLAVGVLALQLPLMLCAAVLIIVGLPSQTAAVADVLPAARRGIGYALFSFLVAVSTSLGPLVVGIVSDITGSLRTALIVMALPCIPGALVLSRARRTYVADSAAITVTK